VRDALPRLAGEQVAIDGKTLRGSRRGNGVVHLVSAFATRARWVLAQEAVAGKSNEIKAIPALLDLLDLSGAVVSVDAMGCQREIARRILEKEAEYVLALKDNHPSLCEDVRLWLDSEHAKGHLAVHETVEKDHGRLERRRYALSDRLEWLGQKPQWAGLQAVGVAEAHREINGKASVERRYFLCSFNDLQRFAQTVRTHWCIENQEHWVLDVQFGEDANRSRTQHSAQNLALIRRTALNLLRQDRDSKQSLRQRKLRAAFSDRYREQLLAGTAAT
jgi:predicted transposase YbfD/YdcC